MTAARLHVHTTKLSVRWGDMDALGHVNNTVYFQYFEQARIEWLYAQAKTPGFDPAKGPVIVNATCNFLVPLVYPADVEVRMSLASPGRSSMASYYDITSRGTQYADGAAKIVWIEYATGRPTPLPEHIVAPLRALAKGGA
jgi:acyl-CoA thioester hydrolase